MLLLLFDFRLANNDYVTNFLQSNTYLQQPKLPVSSDVEGPRPEVFAVKGPEAGKYSHWKSIHNHSLEYFQVNDK